MGVEYTCIVTKENIEMPVEIPHFQKNDILTIPANCDYAGARNFTDHFRNGGIENSEQLEPDRNHPQIILDILEKIALTDKKFMLFYEADWANVPCDGFEAVFTNGNPIKETVFDWDAPFNSLSAYEYLKIERRDIYRSHDYFSAEEEYLEMIGSKE